jgi:hypothetical protein
MAKAGRKTGLGLLLSKMVNLYSIRQAFLSSIHEKRGTEWEEK